MYEFRVFDVECNFMLPIKPTNWKTRNKIDYQLIDPIIPASFRIRTNIEVKLGNRKLGDL